jgi:isoquinoline 1-oxidoreductase subunit beta
VHHDGSGHIVNYGAIAAAAAKVELAEEPAIKTPDQYRLLGKPTKRLDTALKVNGTASFGIDIRLPDMLYASVVTCPVFGGKLKRYDFAAIKDRPGVHSAVEVPDGVAVIADSLRAGEERARGDAHRMGLRRARQRQHPGPSATPA